MPRLAVIYYSSTGHIHKLAQAVVAGAEETGAEVRMRRVPELAPEEVVHRFCLGAAVWSFIGLPAPARVSLSAISPLRYLPLRNPAANGDHGSRPMSLCMAAGTFSYSISRLTRLYCCCSMTG
jgi:flavodoxin